MLGYAHKGVQVIDPSLCEHLSTEHAAFDLGVRACLLRKRGPVSLPRRHVGASMATMTTHPPMCAVGAVGAVGVQCVMCGVCGVCVLCVWRGLARGKQPVCRFQTPPFVGSKRFCVYGQNARVCSTCALCRYTRSRLEPTHGGHSLSPSLSATMTMITRPVGSLCKHGSDLPQCQSAWASVHSLFAEHVRIMQQTTVLV